MLQLGAIKGHSLFLCLRGQLRSLRMPLFKKGCQRWRFCSVAHSDVNLWQRVCLYVHVCLCCLTSRSTPHLPHLPHWFGPCTRSPPPPPPHITSWQNDSPLWPIETPNTQSFAWLVEVTINPPHPGGLLAHWVIPLLWDPCHFFPSMRRLLPHPPPEGFDPLPWPLWTTQVFTSAVKQSKKKKWNWSKDTGWMWCGNKFPTYVQKICDFSQV